MAGAGGGRSEQAAGFRWQVGEGGGGLPRAVGVVHPRASRDAGEQTSSHSATFVAGGSLLEEGHNALLEVAGAAGLALQAGLEFELFVDAVAVGVA